MDTSFHHAQLDGTPVLRPLWYAFPKDAATFAIDTQFLFGPSVLVSPVIEENSTSVDVYYPNQLFYDFHTLEASHGAGGCCSAFRVPLALSDGCYGERLGLSRPLESIAGRICGVGAGSRRPAFSEIPEGSN